MTAEQVRNEKQLRIAAARLAKELDCGDGVPALTLAPREPQAEAGNDSGWSGPKVTAKLFGLAATIAGQLLIGIAVLAGGSPLIGAFAAVILAVCGLAMILTDAVNRG
ncbi:MAG: hypothetical protein WBM50_28110 [Acidimicrobiales bacterium]